MNKNLNIVLTQSKLLLNDCKKFKNKKDFMTNSDEEFNKLMKEKYIILNTNYNTIFNQCLDGTMDMDILTYMVNQINNINKNKISKHDASVNVGQKLVDKFVKPKIND